MTKQEIESIVLLAFEAGKWSGQVELEEHFDREQYSSRSTAMPNQQASNGNTVTVNLRSQEWRDGVKKSSQEYFNKSVELLFRQLNK